MTNWVGSDHIALICFLRIGQALVFCSWPTTNHEPPTTALSIPLWFLRNKIHSYGSGGGDWCFHTTMVLTQRMVKAPLIRGAPGVSIPLWFLRNSSMLNKTDSVFSCFHTTMVLTQRTSAQARALLINSFPYHYGSYATRTRLHAC